MRVFSSHIKLGCQWRRVRAVGVHSPQWPPSVGRVDDDSAFCPSPASAGGGFGNRLGRPSGNGDFLQLAAGEERHVGAVRRPERIICALGARQHRHSRRTDALDVHHVLAGGVIAGHKGEHPAVSRERQVAHFGLNRYSELQTLGVGRLP